MNKTTGPIYELPEHVLPDVEEGGYVIKSKSGKAPKMQTLTYATLEEMNAADENYLIGLKDRFNEEEEWLNLITKLLTQNY